MKSIFFILSLLCLVSLMSSCQKENELARDNMGYLRLEVGTTTSVSTKSSVPENYNPQQLYVEIKDETGSVVESTENYTEWKGKQFKLKAGSYTITASSNGFDGNASGVNIPYYKGSAQVTILEGKEMTADITCKLANVKVTVNFDETFKKSFANAIVLIESKVTGINNHKFTMGVQSQPVYFPEGNLKASITVVNKEGKSFSQSQEFTKVKARDHYILNYKVAESGSVGDIKIEIDDTEKEYTYAITVPVTSTTQLKVEDIEAWSNFAYLKGEVVSEAEKLEPTNIKFEYREKNIPDWTVVDAILDGDKYRAKVTELRSGTEYVYRLIYKGESEYASALSYFTTETAVSLYNGDLNEWYSRSNNNTLNTSTWYAVSESYYNVNGSFWDSSNPGTTTGMGAFANINPTQPNSEIVYEGMYSAKLQSQFKVKFAAASLYSGKFNSLVETKGAKIDFGQPFTERPTQLTGWFQYSTGAINYVGKSQPANTVTEEDQDLWSAYIVLTTGTYQLNNTDMAGTSKDFAKLLVDDADDFVVAYGALPDAQCIASSVWKEFTIDLVYKNLEKKPTHIIIVFSSSKYGDYFTGSTSSLLYLDDLELIYGDNPQVK